MNPFKPPKDIYWRHHEGLVFEWTGKELPLECLFKHIIELIGNSLAFFGLLLFTFPILIPIGIGWCIVKTIQAVDRAVFRGSKE